MIEEGITASCANLEATMINLEREKRQCDPAKSSDHIDYGPVPLVNETLNQKFVRKVRNGGITESLYISRHNCCYMKGAPLDLPRSIRLFDWYYIGRPSGKFPDHNLSHSNPRTIFWSVNYVQKLLSLLTKGVLPPLKIGEKRVLAFAQDDGHYSSAGRSLKQIRDLNLFSKILWEAKDAYTDDVGTTPLGLNNFYLQRCDPHLVQEEMLTADFNKKTKGVLAAWGGVWTLDQLKDRKAARAFVSKSCLVHRQMFAKDEYWRELASHRFLMAPEGNGIQSPKVAEALAVLTIPIVHRNPATTDLLMKHKWPLVLVDSYEEITSENLKKWFQELSPHLVPFRERLLAERALADILDAQ